MGKASLQQTCGSSEGNDFYSSRVLSVIRELQDNLIRSHAAGVGSPLSPERTRMLLALRINILAKGHSGVSLETLHRMENTSVNRSINSLTCGAWQGLKFLHTPGDVPPAQDLGLLCTPCFEVEVASCLSYVPERGTVGASGDLAPLAHLALGLMGEGNMWSLKTGWAEAKYVLEIHGLKPISLGPKEGLALINGTQLITALGAEAVERAQAIARQADVIAALTLQVLKGTTKAFDSDIHAARPHPGQVDVAWRLRSVLDSDVFPSEITGEDTPALITITQLQSLRSAASYIYITQLQSLRSAASYIYITQLQSLRSAASYIYITQLQSLRSAASYIYITQLQSLRSAASYIYITQLQSLRSAASYIYITQLQSLRSAASYIYITQLQSLRSAASYIYITQLQSLRSAASYIYFTQLQSLCSAASYI
ncbi:hypothetical protein JZ751_024215 [Albula glossodonta]|uniref:Phenylalanine ammonia-lyase n=1 Tax=Albula glossodonta TaxID=121402 RepID=A0A8T2MWT0_9TELE|nr:hypothetical protein JZ751_024215 [Albula glossodonta]